MDIVTFHSIWTLVVFFSFLGVVWWAYGKSRKARFEEDANIIFADEKPSSKQPQLDNHNRE